MNNLRNLAANESGRCVVHPDRDAYRALEAPRPIPPGAHHTILICGECARPENQANAIRTWKKVYKI